MTEYERIREKALLTDEQQCDWADQVNECHPNLSVPIQNTILNLIQEVAQAQLDKALKTEGIEIRADDQGLPLSGPYNLAVATFVRQARQEMLKAGFIRVIPKKEEKDES